MPQETELKFKVDAATFSKLKRRSLLRTLGIGQRVTKKQSTLYFDTPDFLLMDAGVALRIRQSGRSFIQTVKSRHTVVSPGWVRDEWEYPVSSLTPDLTLLCAGEHPPLLCDIGLAAQLQPIFRTDIRRTALLLGEADWQVEVVFDEGAVVLSADEQSLPICEIELELKTGTMGDLLGLAARLFDGISALWSVESKSELGYRLLRSRPLTAYKGNVPRLEDNLSRGQAFQGMARAALEQVLINQDVFAQTQAPEAVHQMRVGLRRLRAVMGLFRDCFDPDHLAKQRAALRDLLTPLGHARDQDVFAETILLPARKGLADHRELAALETHYAQERSNAAAALAKTLQDPATLQTLLGLGAWIETSLANMGEDHPAHRNHAAWGRDFVRRRCRKLRKTMKRMDQRSLQEWHDTRLEVKKLRYSLEFLSSLWSGRRIERLIQALAQLQDQLGKINDYVVACDLLQSLATQQPDLAYAAGLVGGWHSARVPRLRRKARRAGQKWLHLPPLPDVPLLTSKS